MARRPVLQPGRVSLRHVKLGSGPGQVEMLGRSFVPSRKGLRGRSGFQSGHVEERLGEEGTSQAIFPNAAGSDGTLHRERFDVVAKGKVQNPARTDYQGGEYRVGDEWIEFYWAEDPEPLAVGTPTGADLTKQELALPCVDGLWLLKKTRETAAGFWHHAPRDVIEHYSGFWQDPLADDFPVDGETYEHSGTEQASSDGRWLYTRAESDHLHRPSTVRLHGGGAKLRSQETFDLAGAVWRFEAAVRVSSPAGTVRIGLEDSSANDTALVRLTTSGAKLVSRGIADRDAEPKLESGRLHVAVECRDRWTFFYVGGKLAGVQPRPTSQLSDGRLVVSTTSATLDVELCVFRKLVPFLMRGDEKGDYHLPGKPTPGGLVGVYFSDEDLSKLGGELRRRVLDPTREPFARQLDEKLDYGSGFELVGIAAGSKFSVRWTGSVYLPLADHDFRLRARKGSADCRVWVGKTMHGQQLIDAWPTTGTVISSWLRAHLGQTSGWYPIVVEYRTDGNGTLILESERTGNEGSWIVLGSGNDPIALANTQLSPLGCYEQQVRFESHYDVVQQVLESIGYQLTVKPKSLESGLFPGQIAPKVRLGRDTEKILDEVEASETGLSIRAEEVADSMLADGAGLGDDDTTLTAEAFDLEQAGKHLFVSQEFESLSEITIAELLEQRLGTHLIFRGSPWEEVKARPRGFRELLDRFPLTGELAEFKWEPGDGVRLMLPEIGVEDRQPRQILGVSRDLYPDGLGAPEVIFRQRPRSIREQLRKIRLLAMRMKRNYQGQVAIVPGNLADEPSATEAVLPADLLNVVSAELVVVEKSNESVWPVVVNGSTVGVTFSRPGRYDLTPYVARQDGVMSVTTTGSGTARYQLELRVKS